jgi:hypothetical protein
MRPSSASRRRVSVSMLRPALARMDGARPFSCSTSAASRCSTSICWWPWRTARDCAARMASCSFSVKRLMSIFLIMGRAGAGQGRAGLERRPGAWRREPGAGGREMGALTRSVFSLPLRGDAALSGTAVHSRLRFVTVLICVSWERTREKGDASGAGFRQHARAWEKRGLGIGVWGLGRRELLFRSTGSSMTRGRRRNGLRVL